MTYRKLRIAWSVAWGIVAALLVTLWVRSYWKIDFLTTPIPNATQITSGRGAITVAHPIVAKPTWMLITVSIAEVAAEVAARGRKLQVPSRIGLIPFQIKPMYMAFSHLYLLFTIGLMAVLPWLRRPERFSLRTLLIAMTVIAAGLGLLVYLS
jgi:hypothetical protein